MEETKLFGVSTHTNYICYGNKQDCEYCNNKCKIRVNCEWATEYLRSEINK